MKLGEFKGEVCNRGACKGIIEEYEKEGSCSCHIAPPCSYCTEDNNYCPECDWSGEEEQRKVFHESVKKVNVNEISYRRKEVEDLDKSKIDWITKPHTHFSMIIEGVCPIGTEAKDVREKVNGTFGGRFEYFANGRFKFIAYTD